jgi:hypothetical protein
MVPAAPRYIGCDEFPVGYSLAGCSPAEPASASPTGNDSLPVQAARQGFLVSQRLVDAWLSGGRKFQRGKQAGAVIVGMAAKHAKDGVQHLAGHRHEGLQFGLVACQ